MFKKISHYAAVGVLVLAGNVLAADEAPVTTIDTNSGRGGEAQRVDDGTEFKVCSDMDNMPFSNSKFEGFENKIAEVIAKDLGKKLSYQFSYDRMGFLRNTLNAKRCDVVMGIGTDVDSVLTSKPYYRTGNVFIWRTESNYNITEWTSPDLKKGIIGVVGQSPATIPMNDLGLIGNARPYRQQRDLNLAPSYLTDDLAKKETDIVIAWGPIGGYFAKKNAIPMTVVPVPEYIDTNIKGKQYWNISMGVRKKDKERIAQINAAIDRNKDKIDKILADYGVPTVAIVENDSIEKKYHSKSKIERERGSVVPKSE